MKEPVSVLPGLLDPEVESEPAEWASEDNASALARDPLVFCEEAVRAAGTPKASGPKLPNKGPEPLTSMHRGTR